MGDGDGQFPKPWLLLCEGKADLVVLERLAKIACVDEKVKITHPIIDHAIGKSGGRTAFGEYLKSIVVSPDFPNIRAILIVSDSDFDLDKSFKEVCVQLKNEKFPVPDKPGTIVHDVGMPKVCVLMIPIGTRGNLETMCIEAGYSKCNIKGALDTYIDNTPAKDWPDEKLSKMRMQCFLAAICKENPNTTLAGVWRYKNDCIPCDHDVFKDIVSFLSDFEALLESS